MLHLRWAKLGKISWVIVIVGTDGEVIFATASTLTHQVFDGLPNMNRVCFRLRQQYQIWARAEWREVKLQYTGVSMRCAPFSMVGGAASQLGPACDGVGFDPFRSSCLKAAQGTNPSNSR
jgi:hypothetical protein